jgi:signal peptidase I
LHAIVGCLLAILVADTWLLAGLGLPISVVSGSMAPTLLGPHRQWNCPSCGQSFVCSRESLPEVDQAAHCPWCDHPNDPSRGVDLPGQRVLVDRTAFGLRAPRRWEVAVCRSPEKASEWCVKRVVGLPGETVALRDGQVWIDGRVAAKSLATARGLAVPVSEPEAGFRHWQVDARRQWSWRPGVASHRGALSAPTAWLRFGPPLFDASPTDQNESRLLQPADDLILSCTATADAGSTLVLQLGSRGDTFRLELRRATNEGRLLRNGQLLTATPLPAAALERNTRVELAVIDHRVQWAVGGPVLASVDFEPTAGATEPIPPAIGAQGKVDVSRLELHRDVVYTQVSGPAQYRLGRHEYFVLSDNSPHGVDSRHWTAAGGVSGELLVGKAWWW